MEGLLVIDKPPGMRSTRAVTTVKYLLRRGTKVGHAGTLDPFATGMLIILIGKATRRCEQIMGWPKTYEATIKLGATTATDDPSPEQTVYDGQPLQRTAIVDALSGFTGNITQRPPMYSAVKLQGKRACDRVRDGETIQLEPKVVTIHGIELIHYEWPELHIRVECGRGTYIRSIARDLGEKLSVGGYVTKLHRTRIGPLTEEQAIPLMELTAENIKQRMIRFDDINAGLVSSL